METSYTVDFEAEQVRGLIRELTQTDEYGRAGDDLPPFPVHCAFSRWSLRGHPRGRNLPATVGFYGVWALVFTPRRAGG